MTPGEAKYLFRSAEGSTIAKPLKAGRNPAQKGTKCAPITVPCRRLLDAACLILNNAYSPNDDYGLRLQQDQSHTSSCEPASGGRGGAEWRKGSAHPAHCRRLPQHRPPLPSSSWQRAAYSLSMPWGSFSAAETSTTLSRLHMPEAHALPRETHVRKHARHAFARLSFQRELFFCISSSRLFKVRMQVSGEQHGLNVSSLRGILCHFTSMAATATAAASFST